MATEKLHVELALRDLLAISGSLNEVCNGLPLADFENRVGVSREQALKLLVRVQGLLDQFGTKGEPPH